MRGMPAKAVVSAMFVISLTSEISAAADRGFYVGAAGGRSELRLDKQAGIGPVPIAVIGNLPLPDPLSPVPFPPGPLPFPGTPNVVVLEPSGMDADESDVGWNFALGYRVNEYLAAELTYVDAGDASLAETYSNPPSSPTSFPDIVRMYTVNSRGPAVSVLGSLPLSERWEVFLRGGVLFAKQEVEARTFVRSPTAINPRPIERDFSDEVVTIGAGVQWAFLPRWTARLEYQRSDDLQPNEIMGESRLDQASLSVLFGL